MDRILDRLLAVSLSSAALALTALLLVRLLAEATPDDEELTPAPISEYHDEWRDFLSAGRWIGSDSAQVIIVEFGDFQCPYCRRFAMEFQGVRQQFGDTVALVYVHYPLIDIHPFALASAHAAECGGEQGHFPELHDLLFAKQDSLGLKSWMSYAVEAGIPDSAAFAACLQDRQIQSRIEQGIEIGKSINVTATPTMLINGWRFRGTRSKDELEAIIRPLLGGRSPVQ